MNKNDVEKLASFIAKAVQDLQNGGEGCWHYHLGQNLYYVIACAGAKNNYDEEDFEIFATDDSGEFAICGKIAVNIDDLQYDYDFDWYMPYDKNTGDVWDTEREFYKNNNFEQVAKEVLTEYKKMCKYNINDDGVITESEQMQKYKKRKDNARAQIMDILEQNRERAMSWMEYAEQQALIYKIAKRCGLVKELHNEGII